MINTTTNSVTAADEQVSFTATGTPVITGVTHLPGGLPQVNFTINAEAERLTGWSEVTQSENYSPM